MSKNNDFSQFLAITSYEERFLGNKLNLLNLIKPETIEKVAPSLLICDNTVISEEQQIINACILNDLRDLAVIIPSTLARLEMFGPAINAIE